MRGEPQKAWGASHRHLAFIEEVLLLFKGIHHKKTVVWNAQCEECKDMRGESQKIMGCKSSPFSVY